MPDCSPPIQPPPAAAAAAAKGTSNAYSAAAAAGTHAAESHIKQPSSSAATKLQTCRAKLRGSCILSVWEYTASAATNQRYSRWAAFFFFSIPVGGWVFPCRWGTGTSPRREALDTMVLRWYWCKIAKLVQLLQLLIQRHQQALAWGQVRESQCQAVTAVHEECKVCVDVGGGQRLMYKH